MLCDPCGQSKPCRTVAFAGNFDLNLVRISKIGGFVLPEPSAQTKFLLFLCGHVLSLKELSEIGLSQTNAPRPVWSVQTPQTLKSPLDLNPLVVYAALETLGFETF